MIVLDFETRSEADLNAVGQWAYSEHPSTEVICLCWAAGDGPIMCWWPDWLEVPEDYGERGDPIGLLMAVEAGELIEGHNVAFEYSIWNNVMVPRYGWPSLAPEQCRDTMATACYYALPAPLDKLCQVLGLPGKDPEGGRLISKYSKLHLQTARRVIPPVDAAKFVDYCAQDVDQEREVGRVLGDLPEAEEAVFVHDFRVNARGIYLDLAGIGIASDVVDKRADQLAERFEELTGLTPNQRDKIIAWAAGHGVELENLQAEYLERLLGEEEPEAPEDLDESRDSPWLPPGPVREALEIRQRYAKASTKKLDAMARQRGRDGRARFQTRYHGAVTGRNTGSGFQPLNLARGWEWTDPPDLVRDISYGSPEWLDAVYGDAMAAVSAASRHWLTAERGSRLIAGDFASVEAVVLAVLAGEEWKVEAFRRGEPIYERTADKIYQLPPGTVTKKTHPAERQDGKTCELACGYQGALRAWRKFDSTDRHSDESVVAMVRAWRREHPAVVAFWRELEHAALQAVRYPGTTWTAQTSATGVPIYFERVDGWLTMVLPDSKRLWYWAPQIKMRMPPWHDPVKKDDCAVGECDCEPLPRLSYLSWKNKQFKPVDIYGGKLAENATTATCREILKHCEMAVEAQGYPVIFSVYDEIVAEVSCGDGSVEQFQAIMQSFPNWAADWPIRAEVWEGERYKK